MSRHILVPAIGLCVTAWLSGPTMLAGQHQESVAFDGRVLLFASEAENPGEHIKEYIPENETLESWTALASIRQYPALEDPKAAVANLVEALKRQNPQARSAVQENSRTGDLVVDFITWPPDESFVEFNVWKYSRRDGGGLVAHQYALRDYRNPKGFLRGLGVVRARLVGLMADGGLKPVAGSATP